MTDKISWDIMVSRKLVNINISEGMMHDDTEPLYEPILTFTNWSLRPTLSEF